jgi:nitroreductase
MDALEALMTRRSIRHFTAQPVSGEYVEQILRGAMAAPSARNEQAWHFVVINDRQLLDAIPRYHQFAEMLKEASLAIAVCGDMRHKAHEEYWQQNCAAATENLLLTAHALGLGAVWLGIYPKTEQVGPTKQLLNLPDGVIPLCIVAVGHPAEIKEHADRFDKTKIHWNGW